MFPQVRTGERYVPKDSKGKDSTNKADAVRAPVSLTEARPTPCGDVVTPETVASPEGLHTTLLHVLRSLEHTLSAFSSQPGEVSQESLRVATEELRCAKTALKIVLPQGEMPAEARAAHL